MSRGRPGFHSQPRRCSKRCRAHELATPHVWYEALWRPQHHWLQWKSAVPNKIRSARIEQANRSWQFAAIESPPCSLCTLCGLVLVHDSWFVCVGLSFVWCLAVFILTNGEADFHSASCLRVLALCMVSCCAWNSCTSASC